MTALTHEQIDMTPIYNRYPKLAQAEHSLDARFERRRSILNFIPRHKRGAELGVFTGQFSELIVQIAKPVVYFAVDPWSIAYGEFFPNWGDYTANGQLETQAGYEAARHRLSRFPAAEVITMPAIEWLETLEANSLDWVYVDSTHQYEPTLNELIAIESRLSPEGVLLGDDCWARRDARHYGVFRAVRDFCRVKNFEIIAMDYAGQWAARRSID